MQNRLIIDGAAVPAASGQTFPTLNPATGETLTEVARAGAEDVDRAVAAARTAMDKGPWASMDGAARGQLLWKLGERMLAETQALAELETRDSGKTIRDTSGGDVPGAARCFQYFAGWADKIQGDVNPVSGPFLNYTRREPVGVVGAIIPWNFPILMAAWKLGPALAAGNTVVLKPAEQTPLTAIRLGELALEVGFPPGVVNVLPGFGEEAGAALVRHPGVNKIAFTGSTEVGKLIQREAAATLKRVTLELGGKSPNIVFADADLEQAVRGALTGIFYNQGQVCTAGSRLLLERSVHDAFLAKLLDGASKMQPGDPLSPKSRMGPLVSQQQLERVLGYVAKGKAEGARLEVGGERVGDKGYFVPPTVFTGVTNDMTIAREEIFGPVLSVIPFDDVADATRIANDTIYGLAAAVWTRDVGKAHAVAHAIQAGTVWINTYMNSQNASPFGGYKQSGVGRELGSSFIEHYTELKSVWVRMG